jgi:hypothetical protein
VRAPPNASSVHDRETVPGRTCLTAGAPPNVSEYCELSGRNSTMSMIGTL